MLKKYAQVTINQANINIDKYFTYKVPEELSEKITIGQRVIIPFGKGSKKIDGFIMNVTEETNIENNKLKYIEQIVDIEPILTIGQIKLVSWIRNYYLCMYIEAIQLMIPSGCNLKRNVVIIPNQEKIYSLSPNNNIESILLKHLIQHQDGINLEELKKNISHNSLQKSLKELSKKKFIFIQESFHTIVKEKKEKYISLSGKFNNKSDYINKLKANAHMQKSILDSLDNYPYNYNQLKNQLNFSKGSIDSLLKKGLIKITDKMIFRNPYKDRNFNYPSVKLTMEQNKIIKVFESMANKKPEKFLIHGVTGSGKTEIYLNMIEIMLNHDKQSILLVPEISLTPQMVERVMGRFGNQVSVLHSGLSLGERFDQWNRIKSGKINIVIGARSAVFAPLKNLGLIIIDEEHETTYKSSNRPRYHAREIAEKRLEIEKCHLVLGSATPSIESYYKSENKFYNLFKLPKRIDNIPMPEITLVDMREELKSGNYSILSTLLRKEISNKLEKKQQIILFLNRRGYSTFISCRQCGHVESCPNCDVSLIFHRNKNTLLCHYCGFEKNIPKICPSCKSDKIKYFGTGTQKVENIISKEFPNAKTVRMDVDTTSTKGAHDIILNKFKNQEVDILIGTQMIAKGLDFPNVTLVGIIIADTSLNLPDFRAAERTFQLTTQVAGRAGRGALLGNVIVQTYQPEHYSLNYAKYHDYNNFYSEEISIRKEMLYPPFSHLINIIFSHEKEDRLIKFSNSFYFKLIDLLKTLNKVSLIADVYKPVPAQISKINNKYRWHMIIKTKHINVFQNILDKIYRKHLSQGKEINMSIDIDPISLL